MRIGYFWENVLGDEEIAFYIFFYFLELLWIRKFLFVFNVDSIFGGVRD